MVSEPAPTQLADEAITRLTARLGELGVPSAAIQALVDGTDPGRCHDLKDMTYCQLDLGHPEEDHLAVHPPNPGTKTQIKWATKWHEKFALDYGFTLPDESTPAMRVHAELVDEPGVFICQPVTDTLVYVHIRLGRNDTGLTAWLARIGLGPQDATRTEHGDYLARGRLDGARVALIAHAHSYR
ncbi:hypothetical protein ACWEAF_30930 [Streptomyces sp. NPDC005071]